MNLAPGLIGDVGGASARVFLGTQPSLVVEARLLKQMQPVYPWYASRKRVKEQANEFLECDLSTLDPELFLRHSHVFFSRRQVHQESVEKLVSILEKGKLPKEASPSALQCFSQILESSKPRVDFEEKRLFFTKKNSKQELEPTQQVESWDLPCLIRLVEESESGMADAEPKARAFLPASTMFEAAQKLTHVLVPQSSLKADRLSLDKKDAKLVSKFLCSTFDYKKVGTVEKMRPLDATTYFRFFGERVTKPAEGLHGSFQTLLWGNLLRRYASHPEFLLQSSAYWAGVSGVSKANKQGQLSKEIAEAVCLQQQSLPATRFKLLHQYTNAEFSKQMWRKDWFVPLHRLLPLVGYGVSEDLMASMLVDAAWKQLDLSPWANPLEEGVIKNFQQFVQEMSALRQNDPEVLLSRVQDAAKVVIPPTLTDDERAWVEDFDAGKFDKKEMTADEVLASAIQDEGEEEEVIIIEEGEPETDAIPNENLK